MLFFEEFGIFSQAIIKSFKLTLLKSYKYSVSKYSPQSSFSFFSLLGNNWLSQTEGDRTFASPPNELVSRDLDDFNSLESDQLDIPRQDAASPVKSIRQHIYESVSSNPSLSHVSILNWHFFIKVELSLSSAVCCVLFEGLVCCVEQTSHWVE